MTPTMLGYYPKAELLNLEFENW